MSATTLEQIRSSNESFRAGRPKPLESGGPPFVVVACIDAHLTGYLEEALGLPRNRAVVVRVAGNRVGPDTPDAARSIAAAIFLKGASEVFVVGHADCAMACFSATEVIEAFRKAGVQRNAFGDGDLREWFGAFPNVRGNVLDVVKYLRGCPWMPRRIRIHGLILRPDDGSLEVTVNGDLAPDEPIRPPEPAQEQKPAATAAPPAPPAPAPPSKAKGGPVVIAEQTTAAAVPAPQTMMDAMIALREVLVAEHRNPLMRHRLAEFSNLVRKEKNPVRILMELEKVLKDSGAHYPQLPGIVGFLRASLEAHGAGAKLTEFMRRIVD